MGETPIVLMRTRPRLTYRSHRRRVSDAKTCATCKSTRGVRKLDRYAGFCSRCLDRSRIHDGDDLGGEC